MLEKLWDLWHKGNRQALESDEFYKAEYFDEFLVKMEDLLIELEEELE